MVKFKRQQMEITGINEKTFRWVYQIIKKFSKVISKCITLKT